MLPPSAYPYPFPLKHRAKLVKSCACTNFTDRPSACVRSRACVAFDGATHGQRPRCTLAKVKARACVPLAYERDKYCFNDLKPPVTLKNVDKFALSIFGRERVCVCSTHSVVALNVHPLPDVPGGWFVSVSLGKVFALVEPLAHIHSFRVILLEHHCVDLISMRHTIWPELNK